MSQAFWRPLGTNYLVLCSGNERFYANCIFFLAISVFLPLIASLLYTGVLWTLIYLFVFFLWFQLVTSTIIVYFLTIGILLPPIVIFSFLLCGLASLDSNHPSFFPLFWLLAFLLFAFLHLRFCYHAPTKNHWFAGRPQAGWQKQRRDHDRSSSGFRRPWRQGCPGCVRGRPCYLRVSGALSSGQMVFGKASFRFVVLYLGGRLPIMRVHVFDFPRRMTYPWRLLSRCMVQSSLSKSRLFFPIKTSLMVPG